MKMLMKIALPKMGELLVMMMTMISPSGREVPPAESLRRRAKVLLPKFRLEAAALRPESPPPNFFWFLGIYTRSWAPEAGQAGHDTPGRALVGCAHLGAPSGGSWLQKLSFIE